MSALLLFTVPRSLFAPCMESFKRKLLNLKVCRLKSVVTSISLNPCVSPNLKKNTKWYFQGGMLWKCLAQKHLLRCGSRVHIQPLSLSFLSVFQSRDKMWQSIKPLWGFYTIHAALLSYLGGILLAIEQGINYEYTDMGKV